MSVRVWWRLVKIVKFATCSRLARKWTTRERPHEKYMLESKLAKLYFVCHFMTWPTCEWPAKLSACMILIVLFSFLYPHYIRSHYLQNCKETLRERTLAIYLRVRDCKPIIIYTISLNFPLLLPLQLQIIERFLA